jgi:hypothetical protein
MTTVQKSLLQLFLLGFVAALAGWLLFQQLGQREVRREQKRAARRVLPAGLEITRVALSTPEQAFELERSGEGWRLVAPLQTAADKAILDRLVHHLLGLERLREVGRERADGTIEPPGELWLFGLEPARFTVTLSGVGSSSVVLRVGKKNNFDGSIYVKRDDAAEVLQVDGALEYQVDKSLYQLRDKRLLPFAEEDVSRVTVHRRDGASFAIERGENGFVLAEPRRLPADRSTVSGMLSALANVRAQEFVSELGTLEERTRYGLDLPVARVVLAFAGGEEQEVWLTRQAVGGDSVHYAMRAGDHPILLLGSAWVLDKVDVDPETLRDRRLLRFSRDEVRRLTLRRGDERLVFERRRDEMDTRDEWHILEPEVAPADDAALAGILYRLGAMKAKRILHEEVTEEELAAAGLDEPEVVVELHGAQGSLGSVRFAAAEGRERSVYAGERIDRVESSFADELSFGVDDYRGTVP